MINRTYSNLYQPRSGLKSHPSEVQTTSTTKSIALSNNLNKSIEIANFCIDYVNSERFILNENSFIGGGISSLLRPTNGIGGVGTMSSPALPSFVLDVRNLLDTMLAQDLSTFVSNAVDCSRADSLLLLCRQLHPNCARL
jgi:hypothetical protein